MADAGRLVGIVRRPRLLEVDPSTPVGQLMDEPVAVEQTDSLEAAMALRPLFGTDPIPVWTPTSAWSEASTWRTSDATETWWPTA